MLGFLVFLSVACQLQEAGAFEKCEQNCFHQSSVCVYLSIMSNLKVCFSAHKRRPSVLLSSWESEAAGTEWTVLRQIAKILEDNGIDVFFLVCGMVDVADEKIPSTSRILNVGLHCREGLRYLPDVPKTAFAKSLFREDVIAKIKSLEFDASVVFPIRNQYLVRLLKEVGVPTIFFNIFFTEETLINAVTPWSYPTWISPIGRPEGFFEITYNLLRHWAFRRYLHLQFLTVDLVSRKHLMPTATQSGTTALLYQNPAFVFLSWPSAVFQLGNRPISPHTISIGCLQCSYPEFAQNQKEEATTFEIKPSTKGLLVVSLGQYSSWVYDQPAIYDALVKVFLEFSEFEVILKWPGDAARHPASHILIMNRIPQVWLLRQNPRLFISHCGANGANEFLHFGVPTICVPIDFDQPAVARYLFDLGLIWILSPTELSCTSCLREKIIEALDPLSPRAAAIRLLGAKIRSSNSTRPEEALVKWTKATFRKTVKRTSTKVPLLPRIVVVVALAAIALVMRRASFET